MRRALLAVVVAVGVSGCATFEDPTIVLDLRVIAIQANPPEQVVNLVLDPASPPTVDELLALLGPITIRALIAEPGRARSLSWRMTACIIDDGGRCLPDRPQIPIRSSRLADPEVSQIGDPCPEFSDFAPGGVVCAQLVPDAALAALLYEVFRDDPARGTGGIDFGISLWVYSDEEPRTQVFASKQIRIAPRIPADRAANHNPNVDQLLLGRGGLGFDIDRHHCAGSGRVDDVRSGDTVTLFPIARDGDKEEFVLPTIDGGSERFTEILSYQWIAIAGSFADDHTGGPPDAFGNITLDGTEWTAPQVREPTDIALWLVQRDGRLGVTWRDACLRVVP